MLLRLRYDNICIYSYTLYMNKCIYYEVATSVDIK